MVQGHDRLRSGVMPISPSAATHAGSASSRQGPGRELTQSAQLHARGLLFLAPSALRAPRRCRCLRATVVVGFVQSSLMGILMRNSAAELSRATMHR